MPLDRWPGVGEMGVGRRRWLASERIAFRVLEERGFRILETHRKLVLDGVEVGEVDALAEGPDGERYVVEVKAGRLDVHGVRQVYTAAVLEDAKPLVVAKGFADDAAKKLAESLGVEVIELEDVFLVDSEELEEIVHGAVVEGVAEALSLVLNPPRVPPEELDRLKAVASSRNILEAAKRLGVKPGELRETVKLLKSASSIARRGGWRGVTLTAQLVLAGLRMRAALDALYDASEKLSRTNP